MQKVAVLVSGGGTNLQAVLDAVKSKEITNAVIDVVISNKSDAYALKRAENAGVEGIVIAPSMYADREEFNKALLLELNRRNIDLVVLAGYLVILPAELVKAYKNRIINVHPSLIPSFCGQGCYGLKVHEMVLERGCKVTGATVHFVDEGTDTGPIILQKAVEIRQGDTPEILQRRVMEEAEWKLLPRAIQLISEGKVEVMGKIANIREG